MSFSKLPERLLAAQGQKNAIPHNNFKCRSHFFPGLEFLGNMRSVILTAKTRGTHVFYDTFASPKIGTHVFYDTFASPTIETHVFYDTFASRTIGTHVFYDTSESPTIGTHACYDTFASPTTGTHVFYDTFKLSNNKNKRKHETVALF